MKIKKLNPMAIVPTYATKGSACFDIYASSVPHVGHFVAPGMSQVINTDLAFEIPEGQVMLVFSRSGHGFKDGIRLANCTGIIDSDYRGELKVKLTSDLNALTVHNGDRIAQGMLVPVSQISFEVVDDLSETDRGTGGMGSTGK